jgi:hypothetical protein
LVSDVDLNRSAGRATLLIALFRFPIFVRWYISNTNDIEYWESLWCKNELCIMHNHLFNRFRNLLKLTYRDLNQLNRSSDVFFCAMKWETGMKIVDSPRNPCQWQVILPKSRIRSVLCQIFVYSYFEYDNHNFIGIILWFYQFFEISRDISCISSQISFSFRIFPQSLFRAVLWRKWYWSSLANEALDIVQKASGMMPTHVRRPFTWRAWGIELLQRIGINSHWIMLNHRTFPMIISSDQGTVWNHGPWNKKFQFSALCFSEKIWSTSGSTSRISAKWEACQDFLAIF